jgi:hypothetical protein
MAVDITAPGATGTHSFARTNVNYDDNFVYFKDINGDVIPSALEPNLSFIYAPGGGSLGGVNAGDLVFITSQSTRKFSFSSTLGGPAVDLTGVTPGGVSFNIPVLFDSRLSIDSSMPDNQAVKYYTTGDPLIGLTSGETYFLKNVSISDFIGQQSLYDFTSHTFTTCGRTGRVGPSLQEMRDSYVIENNWDDVYLSQGAFLGYQDWTVPVSGVYTFTVRGAAGNNGTGAGNGGGRGAVIQADINLTKGEVITIAVGQRGENQGNTQYGGGGGGTFVVRKTGNEPLLVAGGGSSEPNTGLGRDAVLTSLGGTATSGATAGPTTPGFGGLSNNPTSRFGGYSGAGGGFNSRGQDASRGTGGGSFLDGLTMNTNSNTGGYGGFGGGGQADGSFRLQGAGGGGYSGGAGARSNTTRDTGGGGGCFIAESAINVGTSTGLFDGDANFGGEAIVNLNSYNTGEGSVDVVLQTSFTSGSKVYPTALDSANDTNQILIEAAGNSYHAFVPINFDVENNQIHSAAPHTLSNGSAVTFTFQNVPPEGLSNGPVYYIKTINPYTYQLSQQPDLSTVINLTKPASRDLTSSSTINRVVVNIDTDVLTIPNHGFLVDQPIQYNVGDGTPIIPLQDQATYYVAEVINANQIKIKSALNAPVPINFTAPGTGTAHSFIFITVNFLEDTLYIPNHGLTSGQAVRYNDGGNTPIGGLTTGTLYYVVRVDASLIRLSTTKNLQNLVNLTGVGSGTQTLLIESLDFVNDTITLPSHGYIQGELVQYDARGQQPIAGLTTATPYYVIFVDGDNIKLATTPENAESGTAVDLQDSPAGVGRHTLTSLSQTPDGIYEVESVPTSSSFTARARGSVPAIEKVFNPRTSIDLVQSAFKIPSHGFITGTKVTYSQGESATDVAGLVDSTDYFVVPINRDYFRLASTQDNADAGITLTVSDFGTGIAHSFTTSQINGNITGGGSVSVAAGSVLVNGVGTSFSKILKVGDNFRLFPPNIDESITFADSDINTVTNRVSKAHNFTSGDTVVFSSGGGVPPSPLVNGYYYFVRAVSETEITLHGSIDDAVNNVNIIDFTTQGTGSNFSFTRSTPVSPIIRTISAIGSDTQITVSRPYSSAYTAVSYSYPTFVYVRPQGYSLHRPFDGGVEMSAGAGTSFAQIVRQTRKYFRYQSGKGIQTSFGINFQPSIDIESMIRFSPTQITCRTRRPHGLVSGLFITVSQAEDANGQPSTIYNGNFQVTVVDLTTFRITATTTVPEGQEARAYGYPQFYVREWSNGAVRSGMFDFQNGSFFQFDGQEIYCVRRSSTQQLAGTIAALEGSEQIFGTNTQFTAQLTAGDYIVLRGQTYKVAEIESDTRLSIRPEYKGASGTEKEFDPTTTVTLADDRFDIVSHGFSDDLPVVYNSIDGEPIGGLINGRTYYVDLIDNNRFRLKATPDSVGNVDLSSLGTTTVHSFVPAKSGIIATLTVDVKVPQAEWSVDPCDGSGPTGYNLDTSRIQMAYIDYSWYGAGKIRFGFKTLDGQVQYVHEFVHNNFLYESYFRSGNLPSRYEVTTFENPTYIPFLFHWGTSVIMDGMFDDDRAYLFTATSQTLDVPGTTPKSFASLGINLDTDLFTVQSHGFRTGDTLEFQSISPDGTRGQNSQNPATAIVGSNTFANLINNNRYGVLVNSPNLIHLTPPDVTISLGSTQQITSAQSGRTVTIVTTNDHDLPNNSYVGTYGSSRVSNGPYTVTVSNPTTFSYTVPAGPGVQVNITNTSLTSNVATITTSGAHGYEPGDTIIVAGATNGVYNGTYTVATTPSTNVLTYARTNANITSASSAGTVSISIATAPDAGLAISEVINFTSRGNTQYTYFLFPEGSINNTSGPNYQPLISLRLSPSVSEGLTGKLGDRDVINRMQLRIQEVGISTNELVEVKLLINPRLNNLNFQPVESPSLTQVVEHTSADTVSGGTQVYNFKASGGQGGTELATTVNVEELFELSNSILGGNSVFPDGPDILTIAVSRLTGNDTLTSAKMTWTEAQA